MRIAFAIDSEVICGRLVKEAARLKCDPRQLGVALVTVAIDGMLVDSILDGEDPRHVGKRTPGAPVRVRDVARQQQILAFLGDAIQAEGSVALTIQEIAEALDMTKAQASLATRALIAAGDLTATRKEHRKPTIWSMPCREASH